MSKLHAYRISKLQIVEPNETKRTQALAVFKRNAKALASLNLNTVGNNQLDEVFMKQPDLLYVEAVLVTEGVNDNDDAFLHEELWKAQGSPILKPINVGHNDREICGVMYGVEARKLDGTPINQDDGEPFELIMHGVVWHYLPHLKQIAQNVAEKFARGNCYVSMECWFEDYNYGIFDQDGRLTDVIGRCDATAHLERHLRVNGGTGIFNGNRISRALTGITFGGVGFVDVPANQRSDVTNMFLFEAYAEEEIDSSAQIIESQESNNVVKFREDYTIMNDIAKKAVAGGEINVQDQVMKGIQNALQGDRERVAAENTRNELENSRKEIAKLQGKLDSVQSQLVKLGAAVDEAFDVVKAGATGDTPEEIARIDRANNVKGDNAGDAVWSAKLQWLAKASKDSNTKQKDAVTSLQAENEALKAKLRGFERTDEITVLFFELVTEEELNGLVQAGLSQSDEGYTAWLDEKKLFARKMIDMKKGKNGDDEEMKVEKKTKSRMMVPADETEEQKDYGVVLRSDLGKKPGSIPAPKTIGSLEEIADHFEEVDEMNPAGAEIGVEEDADGNPYSKVIAELFESRLKNKRTLGVVDGGGN